MSLCIGLDLGVYSLCLGCVYHGVIISLSVCRNICR